MNKFRVLLLAVILLTNVSILLETQEVNFVGGLKHPTRDVKDWGMDINLSLSDASFTGESIGDYSGEIISNAGDVNGDGYGDILIGAYSNGKGGDFAGQTYLIFGSDTRWSMYQNLSTADASFIGENAHDWSGSSISGAGDVNGDGYDDILIGAYKNSEGGTQAGQTYLFLGKPSGWSIDTSLASADASFIGEVSTDFSGYSVSGAGDVDGDGYDDILIGAYQNDEGGGTSGQTYLVFGKPTGWSMDTSLSSVDASFIGEFVSDMSGYSVSSAGDVNGDGYDDILIGAYQSTSYAGQTYLILGKPTGWSMDTSLSSADASFIGESGGDWSGSSISDAGDVNDDGFADILIGAYGNDEGGNLAGQTYLILGKETPWSMDTSLSSADASFIGEFVSDKSGHSVSGTGDVNSDGFDDILIGAYNNDEGGDDAGQVYLILGKNTEWVLDMDLSLSNASFIGESSGDFAGFKTVSIVGDVNLDGYDDILIGAPGNDEGGNLAGQTYLVFGSGEPQNFDFPPLLFINNTYIQSQLDNGLLSGELDIRWEANDNEDLQDLEISIYYRKGSEPKVPIVERTMNNGSYIWNTTSPRIPDGKDYFLLVKVTDSNNGSRLRRTMFSFEIDNPDPPVVEILVPVEGDILTGVEFIKWRAEDDWDEDSEILIDIHLSIDEGLTYVPVEEDIENNGNYSLETWLFPDCDKCWIKVIAKDTNGLTSESISENITLNNFPDIVIRSPTENVTISGKFDLYWSATDPYFDPSQIEIDIWLVEVEDTNETLIAENETNDGHYEFVSFPFTDRIEYNIRIEARNPLGNSTMLSPDFTIFNNDGPSVELITPYEDEAISGSYLITWNSTDDVDPQEDMAFTLYYRFEGKGTWIEMVYKQENTGSYLWDTTTMVHGDGHYELFIFVNDTNGGISNSDTVNVTIYNPDNPVIHTADGPSEPVREGEAQFNWRATDSDPGDTEQLKVWFYAKDGDDWTLLVDGVPNENEISINVSDWEDGTYIVKMVVCDCQDGEKNGSTEHIFEEFVVNNVNDPPLIDLVDEPSPYIVYEDEITLSWVGFDADGDGILYTLYFKKEGSEEWFPIPDASNINATSFTWNISQMEDGKYQVRIVGIEDYKDQLEMSITTDIFEIKGVVDLGNDQRGVSIDYGLLFGLGAGFLILVLVIFYIMFLNVRKKRDEEQEEELKEGTLEEDVELELSERPDDQNLEGVPSPVEPDHLQEIEDNHHPGEE